MLRITSTQTDVWFYLTQTSRGATSAKGRGGQKVVISLDLFMLWLKDSPSEAKLRARMFTDGRIEPLTQQDVDEIAVSEYKGSNAALAMHV